VLALGDDLCAVWDADTTTDKDRKQLLRTLLEEVNISLHRDETGGRAELLLRWKGGAITELTVPIKRKPPKIRTDEDTVDLVRRLAVHYPDAKIAGILNRQGHRTPRGLSYTGDRVQGLRHYWGIPCHQPTDDPAEGELLTVADADGTGIEVGGEAAQCWRPALSADERLDSRPPRGSDLSCVADISDLRHLHSKLTQPPK
jgi:hypothetical protein